MSHLFLLLFPTIQPFAASELRDSASPSWLVTIAERIFRKFVGYLKE